MSYKLYVRPRLRMEMMNIVEQIQYKAALVVTGCWQGTSRDKIYDDLGWESLSDRRWYRRLCMFYKIRNHEAPQYLRDHLPTHREKHYNMRNSKEYKQPASRT